jgi:hypothetical protein
MPATGGVGAASASFSDRLLEWDEDKFMPELPEITILARQMKGELVGKTFP